MYTCMFRALTIVCQQNNLNTSEQMRGSLRSDVYIIPALFASPSGIDEGVSARRAE